jgi:hypothetical protein
MPSERFNDPIRPGEPIGDITLSVQGSKFSYCSPRVNGLPLDQYLSVEVAVFNARKNLTLPSKIGVDGFDHLFDGSNSPVAGYVSQEDVAKLRAAIAAVHEPAKA